MLCTGGPTSRLQGTNTDPLMLVISFCEHGSLKSHLIVAEEWRRAMLKAGSAVKSRPPGPPLTTLVRLEMCADIAKGMQHLSSYKIVHRDLAARNVLLDSAFACRVADFGLARQTKAATSTVDGDYYRTQNGMLPLRWTAPESLATLKFTPQSDIWSFGIVIVEIFSGGARPYEGLSNPQVPLHQCKPQHLNLHRLVR